ncbi:MULTISPECIES: hypothetical protein [Kribbella]|jgi:hypothetical protein|uniref:Uncharacterized protein n=1 Tax=Kribbella pratensis TaxID=2512112 RepID=A0ABY2FH60_9ACTN|nr:MULTISPECIES: hypothetical protein [Kribbella]TDW90710.1 hypothetical protein EV137_4533 [Kribbella pratensis]TDW98442.1 hypothetical protein EV647_3151 [Kribbella sp. VKM Ac-2566]
MPDESLTDRLVNTDVSALSGLELRAHLEAVDQHMKYLQRSELALLEGSPEVVAQNSQLRDRLDYLRTLDLEELSGPGS